MTLPTGRVTVSRPVSESDSAVGVCPGQWDTGTHWQPMSLSESGTANSLSARIMVIQSRLCHIFPKFKLLPRLDRPKDMIRGISLSESPCIYLVVVIAIVCQVAHWQCRSLARRRPGPGHSGTVGDYTVSHGLASNLNG